MNITRWLIIFLKSSNTARLEPGKFKDLFSNHSKEYAHSRPSYPRPLFDFVVELVQRRNLAWDCATGTGQAAVLLSEYFDQVIASDASKEQIKMRSREITFDTRYFMPKSQILVMIVSIS